MIDGVCCACTIVCIFKANNLVGDGMDRLAVMATFVRVVETGSFTAAARHQNMSQPSVSKSVARLEEALGVRLLMRSTRGLAPTEAGRNFCERARRVVEQADEAIQAARSVGSGLQGRLRVSVGTALGKLHLMPLLPVFLAEHPYLSIDLVLEDRSIDLIEEGIDIGFCLSPLRDSSLTARKVASSKRTVLGAPGYFERAGVPMTPSQLGEHTAVIYTQDGEGSDTWNFRQGTSQISVSVSRRLRVSTSEGLRVAVLRGMGVAIASQWTFAPDPISPARTDSTRSHSVTATSRRRDIIMSGRQVTHSPIPRTASRELYPKAAMMQRRQAFGGLIAPHQG